MAENTRVNETMQGAAAPRQAAIAKEIEIAQALVVNAIYIDNVNLQWEAHQNLKLSLVPYAYDEYQVIDVIDEEDQSRIVSEVNVVQERDAENNPVHVVNDLTSKRYRWKLNPVDDSATSKITQMQEAVTVINAAAGPLISADQTGKFFARFLMAMPNSFLKQAGKAMAQDAQMRGEQQTQMEQQQTMMKAYAEMQKAQAEMLKAQKQGVSLSFSAEDLAKYPALFAFYSQLQGMFNAAAAQGAPGQQPLMKGQPVGAPPAVAQNY
jgi:hypothetical protein